jgi:hypothetical protein
VSGAGETDFELTRVLAEAGETVALLGWLEARLVYDDASSVLADPDADPDERRLARAIRDRLGAIFAELLELDDDEEEAR